jgi:hypothetical protein
VRLALAPRRARPPLAVALAAGACLAMLARATCAGDVRVTHVTVVSPERSAALADADVLIHAGRIAAIRTATSGAL